MKTKPLSTQPEATKSKLVCTWICDACADIPTEMVVKSFKKCGSIDGEEDDALFDAFIREDACNTGSDEVVLECDELEDLYDDMPLSDLQMHLLFEPDNEDDEFLGFSPCEQWRKWKHGSCSET